MKVYLAGPMTGHPNYNFPYFFRVAKALREDGLDVVSPAELDLQQGWVRAEFQNPDLSTEVWYGCAMSSPQYLWEKGPCPYVERFEHRFTITDDFDYEEALAKDIELIQGCDAIVLLPGWETSNGTRRELDAALDAGKMVYEWNNRIGNTWSLSRGGARRLLDEAAEKAADRFFEEAAAAHRQDVGIHASHTDLPMPHEVQVSRTENGGVRINMGPVAKTFRTPEQHEVLGCFIDLLAAATGDGGKKRAAGTKPSWKVDESHEGAIFSHITKWKRGERVDPDSGVHPLVHAAWRCLAIAAQEMAADGLIPEAPVGATLDYPEV